MIHIVVQQKSAQHHKATILQLKKVKKEERGCGGGNTGRSVIREMELGVVELEAREAKDWWPPPEAGRGKERFYPEF